MLEHKAQLLQWREERQTKTLSAPSVKYKHAAAVIARCDETHEKILAGIPGIYMKQEVSQWIFLLEKKGKGFT